MRYCNTQTEPSKTERTVKLSTIAQFPLRSPVPFHGCCIRSFSLPELTEVRCKNSMRFVHSLARTFLGCWLLASMHVLARDYRFDGSMSEEALLTVGPWGRWRASTAEEIGIGESERRENSPR